MAEALAAVGIVANFAGVIGAGIALSNTLYDFAHVLGSAADDIKSLATDVSLFCAVLKQVQSTLTQARAYRLSMTAIDTAQAVIDRCRIIFDDLDAAITKLQGGKSKPDFVTRVKWYFKEKRILLIHEQLKACSAMLHLMLTLLQFAQKIASNRNTFLDQGGQDDQDRLMTHSLFLAQQAAVEKLAMVESQQGDEDVDGQFDLSSQFPIQSSNFGDARAKHRRNRSSQIINGAVHSGDMASPGRARPVSTILGGHMNRLSLVRSVRYSHILGLDDRRLSILQTDELLREWTDQSDPLANNDSELHLNTVNFQEKDKKSYINLTEMVAEVHAYLKAETTHTPTDSVGIATNGTSDFPAMVPHALKIPRRAPPELTINRSRTNFDHAPKNSPGHQNNTPSDTPAMPGPYYQEEVPYNIYTEGYRQYSDDIHDGFVAGLVIQDNQARKNTRIERAPKFLQGQGEVIHNF